MEATKAFDKQVKEMEKQLDASKNAKNNATTQLVASEKRENMGAKVQSPRDIWAKFEKDNAMKIASKVVAKSGISYSFEDAKDITKDFTLLFTTSENETTLFETIGAKSIYSKTIEPNSVDNVLRSFESCKLHFDALRIEANRKQRIENNKEKTIKQMQATPELLLAAAAAALGVSVAELQALQSKS